MNAIALFGLKHSGKSTQARRLADEISWPMYDLDDLIVQKYGQKSIRELYREHGLQWFQDEELQAFCSIQDKPFIIATGGGSMENAALLSEMDQRNVLSCFIDGSEQQLWTRIISGGLPPFLDPKDPRGSFHSLYERRRLAALKHCNVHIDILNGDKDAVYQRLLQKLSPFLANANSASTSSSNGREA